MTDQTPAGIVSGQPSNHLRAVIPFQYGLVLPSRIYHDRSRTIERMPQQPDLISPPLPASPAPETTPASGSSPQPAEQDRQRIPRWLIRAELFLRVTLRIYIGLAVAYAPWSPLFWDQNPIFVQFPTLSIYAANGAVRGIVSGLGLLNMWIALRDAIRYRSR